VEGRRNKERKQVCHAVDNLSFQKDKTREKKDALTEKKTHHTGQNTILQTGHSENRKQNPRRKIPR
jgi:hypothetical protein